jgi:hypothetical protein
MMEARFKGVQEPLGFPTCRKEEYDRKDFYIDSNGES